MVASRVRLLILLLLVATGSRVARAQDLTIDLKSRGTQPGDAVLVTVTTPPGATGVTVTAFGARWPTFKADDGTWRALVGIDLDRKPGTYPLSASATVAGAPSVAAASGPASASAAAASHTAPRVTAQRDLIVATKQFPRRVLKVAPDYVNPSAAQLVRIDQDSVFLRTAYAKSAAAPTWRSGWIRPVAEAANSSFGTRSVFNGEARSPHSGTDFLSPAGTPIHAPAGGQVVCAHDLFFTGNTVIIDHGLGVFSMLAHLSQIDVKEGQTISQGDVVGLVGATGRVTGAHLHWALRVGTARIDPLSALALFDPTR